MTEKDKIIAGTFPQKIESFENLDICPQASKGIITKNLQLITADDIINANITFCLRFSVLQYTNIQKAMRATCNTENVHIKAVVLVDETHRSELKLYTTKMRAQIKNFKASVSILCLLNKDKNVTTNDNACIPRNTSFIS